MLIIIPLYLRHTVFAPVVYPVAESDVCSRYDGSRILVVRGGKNLNTCALMEHNYKKYGAKMDAEHSRVKVTYEKPAEVLGMVDAEADKDLGKEDLTEEDDIQKRLELSRLRMNQADNATSLKVEVENKNNTKIRHRKRHAKKWLHKVQSLKKVLEGEDLVTDHRHKRSISPLDAHIKHGGNALNFSLIALQSDSVSSFESDLLTCYDGKILLTRGFLPSQSCSSVDYLEKSNHMVTEHMVASNGYYYYIFYSDNDLVKNDIHAVFDIYKPTYRFAEKSRNV
ncbi:unnamed protein product [Callosobruchus maculatus]|nr:unnamed protein product [Callosobruchus maculatus]